MQLVKNPPANAEDTRDTSSVPELGISTGEGNGNPLQYSCLESSMDRGAWWATVHRVTENWTWLSDRIEAHMQRDFSNQWEKSRLFTKIRAVA